MKRIVKLKPQRPLGEQIGSVRIVEHSLPTHFVVEQISTGKELGWRFWLDDVIGYCHQNLIPIESIKRLEGAK